MIGMSLGDRHESFLGLSQMMVQVNSLLCSTITTISHICVAFVIYCMVAHVATVCVCAGTIRTYVDVYMRRLRTLLYHDQRVLIDVLFPLRPVASSLE